MSAIEVRPARAADAAAWGELRRALWPEENSGEHEREIARFFAAGAPAPATVLLAFDGERAVGLAELSIRPCAEGCRTERVAYLEGWFVSPEYRRRGVGRALIAAAKDWARAEGCLELASDTPPDNEVSISAHLAAGFADVGLVRCFRMELPAG